jgi:HlyD family secretion protein
MTGFDASLRRHLIAGFAVIALLAGGIGGWAATAQLSGAVIAGGSIVVDGSTKKVQHPTGGVVGDIRVREGDEVAAGDVLAVLDETQIRANLRIVTDSLDELSARQARLVAERDGAAKPAFPADLLARTGDARIAGLIAGEQTLFDTRARARDGLKAQLRERVAQLEQEAAGLKAQADAKRRSRDLSAEELKGLDELRAKNLVSVNRVNELARAIAQLEGEIGQITAQIAATNGKAAEVGLQILQVDQDLRNEAGKELAEIRARATELVQRKVEAEDRLKRVEIRAPIDGVVHELAIHTVGGVIQPGETLMLIVPRTDVLTVEAKVAPREIDRVRAGQTVSLRFTSFDERSTPVIEGKVDRVAADVTEDKRTGLTYYTVRIHVPTGEAARLGSGRLMPGMPVEAFIRTQERSVISYLLKPLTDQMSRAFKDG